MSLKNTLRLIQIYEVGATELAAGAAGMAGMALINAALDYGSKKVIDQIMPPPPPPDLFNIDHPGRVVAGIFVPGLLSGVGVHALLTRKKK